MVVRLPLTYFMQYYQKRNRGTRFFYLAVSRQGEKIFSCCSFVDVLPARFTPRSRARWPQFLSIDIEEVIKYYFVVFASYAL